MARRRARAFARARSFELHAADEVSARHCDRFASAAATAPLVARSTTLRMRAAPPIELFPPARLMTSARRADRRAAARNARHSVASPSAAPYRCMRSYPLPRQRSAASRPALERGAFADRQTAFNDCRARRQLSLQQNRLAKVRCGFQPLATGCRPRLVDRQRLPQVPHRLSVAALRFVDHGDLLSASSVAFATLATGARRGSCPATLASGRRIPLPSYPSDGV